MQGLITGASSGMGREMARYLGSMGWNLILVARREDKLKSLKQELPQSINVEIITMDISVPENAKSLYQKVKDKNIDMLINNAGFGIYGEFSEIDLDREIQLINTNVTAVHILTKLFLNDFIKKDSGKILNVASSAGFLAGPLMASYYASKNYVVRLTQAIYEELRRKGSKVGISCFCPGPVKTEFNNVAGVSFAIKGIDQKYASRYAIDKALKGKLIIMPTFIMRSANFFMRFVPGKLLSRINYNIQHKKEDQDNNKLNTLFSLFLYEVVMKIRFNENKEVVETIKNGLKARGGYCPCKREMTEENKCMCKEFREQVDDPDFEGYCHCMLYYKEK